MIKHQRLRFHDEADNVVRFSDRGYQLPSKRKFKDSGAMIAPVTIARTGIMEYSAGQCGDLFSDWPATKVVKVMTRAEDLFCADSIELYRSAPITIGHPVNDVDTDNASYLQKGNLDGIPFRDGEQLAGHIVLTHSEALTLVDNGVNELSSGHDATLIRLSDEEAEEMGYHAYKTNIKPNHIAIVHKGRAGTARIGDDISMIPSEEVKMYDQEHVTGLEARLDAAVTLSDELKGKLQAAEAKITDEAIQGLVDARLEFMQEVAQFTDTDVSKMSKIEAMKVALKDACGKDYSDRDDAFINIRYSILVEEGGEADTAITAALRDGLPGEVDPQEKVLSAAEAARARMIERNS